MFESIVNNAHIVRDRTGRAGKAFAARIAREYVIIANINFSSFDSLVRRDIEGTVQQSPAIRWFSGTKIQGENILREVFHYYSFLMLLCNLDIASCRILLHYNYL